MHISEHLLPEPPPLLFDHFGHLGVPVVFRLSAEREETESSSTAAAPLHLRDRRSRHGVLAELCGAPVSAKIVEEVTKHLVTLRILSISNIDQFHNYFQDLLEK